MASSYTAAAAALMAHAEQIADAMQGLLGARPVVVGLAPPTIDEYAVWLELPDQSKKTGDDLTGLDQNVVPINVAASASYDVQADDPLFGWKLADILADQFVDEMPDDPVLRHTRTGGVSISRSQRGGDNTPLIVVARMRLNVSIFTR